MKLKKIRTVVLIDDDLSLGRALEKVLDKNGYVVRVFDNGRQALESLQKNSAELVVTDLYMEHMDGMEVVGAVKRNYPHIKIIAMSGGSRVVNMDALPVAKMLGADRTLAKPVEITVLLAAISELDAELAALPPGSDQPNNPASPKNRPAAGR